MKYKKKLRKVQFRRTQKPMPQDLDQLLTLTETVLQLNDMLFLFYCLVTWMLSKNRHHYVLQKNEINTALFKIICIKKHAYNKSLASC